MTTEANPPQRWAMIELPCRVCGDAINVLTTVADLHHGTLDGKKPICHICREELRRLGRYPTDHTESGDARSAV